MPEPMNTRPMKKELLKLNPTHRIKRLKRDKEGVPIPAWARRVGAPADYTVKTTDVVNYERGRKCWTCGQGFPGNDRTRAFVVTPIEALINRTSSEPPQHESCAMFAAQAFARHTTSPNCCCAVWVTGTYGMVANGHPVFTLGDPRQVRWFKKGLKAGREQVIECVDGGLLRLQQLAKENGGNTSEGQHQQLRQLQEALPPPPPLKARRPK